MTDGKKRGRGRPKGTTGEAYKNALQFANIDRALNALRNATAVREAIDILAAYNEEAPGLGLETLDATGLIPPEEVGNRLLSRNEPRAQRKGELGTFTLSSKDPVVDYLARELRRLLEKNKSSAISHGLFPK